MFFTSYEFLLFIFVLFFLYYSIPKKFQWMLLLVASYLFYFIAGPEYLVYILVTTATTFFAAWKIEQNEQRQKAYVREHKDEMSFGEKKGYKKQQKKIRFRWALACILINFGILAAVKYADFAISGVNAILAASGRQISYLNLAVPLGISFYTLQATGYLADIYRGAYPAEKNPFRFALFVSFFPQLIQGPISRFGELGRTLYGEHAFDSRAVCRGLQRILWGYFKKMVIADRILTGVSAITQDPSVRFGAYIFAGMIFYTLELYADFTGGIDITIGIAEVLGIRVQENFIRPYFSKSLKEYWRRWHITMCSWFRDYVFYPFSISKVQQKFTGFSRKHFGERMGRRMPVYLSSFVVWFATGLWHGASWNFIVWGLCNWAVLMISEELEPAYQRFHSRFPVEGKRVWKLFQIGRTFLLVCILNLFDCYTSLADTFRMIASMFTAQNWHILWDGSLLKLGLSGLDFGILAFGTAVMILVSLLQRTGSVREKIAGRAYPVRFIIWFGMFLVILLAGAYGIGYDASQFIYNRF